MKICTKCKISKDKDSFFKDRSKSDGFTSSCKSCISLKNGKYQKSNPIKRSKWNASYIAKNRDKIKEREREWWYSGGGREYATNYKRSRRKADPIYNLAMNLRSSISNIFEKSNLQKRLRTLEILGCSFIEFKEYLESKFEPWMTWDNKGLYNGTINYGWDIDHIIPISSAKTEDDIIKLNHYTNLQPLCGYYNRYIKKDTLWQ